MFAVVLGMYPVLAFGFAAWFAHARAKRVEIVDLSADAPESKRKRRTRAVDAVVLHQMSFSRGNELRRYRKVTAHFIIVPDGTIAQLHPISARLSASNGFNGRSVAIEFAGNLRSTNGKWWRPEAYGRDNLTQAQIDAGRRLLRALQQVGIGYVYGHRQSSASRGNDPGPEIWSTVGQWAIDVLGMSDGGGEFAIGDGRPIPNAWREYVLEARGDQS